MTSIGGVARCADGIRAFALGATMLLAGGMAVVQAQEFDWKLYTFFGANDLPSKPVRGFAEDVTKSSGGRLKITVFTAGELPYKFNEVLRAVATNQVQIGELGMGLNAGELPGLNPFDLPFICTSIPQWQKAVVKIAPILESEIQKKFGLTSLAHWAMPPQQIWLNRPLAKLDDLKGRKIRNWSRLHVDMLEKFGATAVTVTSAEVTTALDRRVVDGAITATVPALDWKFYDVAKTAYMLNFQIPHQILVVNTAEFNKLPKDLQELLIRKGKEWEPKYLQIIITEGAGGAEKALAEKGEVFVHPTKEEMDRAKKLTRPIWEKWAKDNGPIAQKVYEAVDKACNG
jgi:TRAP-type C4-dicarboxylate transport system substrate-binding protein